MDLLKKEYKYHRISRFIDDLCAINNDKEFLTSLKKIYPKEIEFLDLQFLEFLDLFIFRS